MKLYSPLNPKTNPLARELSYLFNVKTIDVTTPLIFIASDRQRFLLAKVAKHSDEKRLESAIFSDDPTLLYMISLLLKEGEKPPPRKPLLVKESPST